MQEFIAYLSEKNWLTTDVLQLKFTRPTGFDYQAGQFVQVFVPERAQTIFRSYSLASTPRDTYLELCVKLLPNGVGSHFFTNLGVGEPMTIRGPLGHFVCTEQAKAHFFIATGVGIAPIMGMIRDEMENKHIKKGIHLLFGLRYEDDVFWLDRLDKFASENDHFSYRLTLSQPKNNWRGLTGRVTEHMNEHPVDHDFYLCGGMDMVKDIRNLLLKNGVEAKKIRMEIF